MTKQTLDEPAVEMFNEGLVSVSFGATTDNICLAVFYLFGVFWRRQLNGCNGKTFRCKEDGFRIAVFESYNVAGDTDSCKFSHENYFFIYGSMGNVWVSVTIQSYSSIILSLNRGICYL